MNARIAVVIVLALSAQDVFSAPYWPEIVGATLNYNNGSTIAIGSGQYITPPGQVVYVEQRQYCTEYGYYGVGEDGDVYTTGGVIMCQGWFDPDFWGAGIPVKIIDLPLYPTKTWSNTYDVQFLGPFTVSGRVNGFGTLSTQEGNLYYYEVEISGISHYVDGTYWLNETYGPVRLPNGATFVSATGIVSSEAHSWGNVKALFR